MQTIPTLPTPIQTVFEKGNKTKNLFYVIIIYNVKNQSYKTKKFNNKY